MFPSLSTSSLLWTCLLCVILITNKSVLAFDDIVVGGGASPVTVVSGHWILEGSKAKHPIGSYHVWWKNSLSINANLIFYTDKEEVGRMILDIRGKDMSTIIKFRNISDMKNRFPDFKSEWINRRDVPSREIGVIWLDKIFMIRDAIQENAYQSDWYVWNDAGNAYYRNTPIRSSVFPSRRGLKTLPMDKFIYSSSWYPITDHSVAGTAFMFHKQIIAQLIEYFWVPYKNCVDQKCGSDQILFSRIKEVHPEFFYQIGYGYGILIENLFLSNPVETHIHNRTQVCSQNSGILRDIFHIMKSMESKDPQKGFIGLCKSLWRQEYPTWRADYAQFLKSETKMKEAKIARQQFSNRIKKDARRRDRWRVGRT